MSSHLKSIKAKIILALLLIVMAVLGSFERYQYVQDERQLSEELIELADQKVTRLAQNMELPLWELDNDWANEILATEMMEKQTYAIIIYSEGELFAGMKRDASWLPVDSANNISGDFVVQSVDVLREGEKIGAVKLYLSRKYMNEALWERLVNGSLAMAALSMLLILFLMIAMERIIISPLKSILRVVKLMAAGDYSRDVEVSRQDEIGMVAEGFNQLKKSVQEREVDLLQSEEKIRLLLDSTAEGVYGLDLEGNCTFANEMCLKLVGYKHSDELIGKNMHALIHHSRSDGSLYPVKECHIYRAFKEGTGVHVDDEVFWRSDGTSFPAEYSSFPIRKTGTIIGSVVSFSDISERRLAEEKIRILSEAMLHAVDAIVILNREGVIEYINPAFIKMTGYAEGEVLNRKYSDFVRKAEEYENLWFSIDSGHSLKDEMDFPRKDGTLFPVLLSSAPIRDAENVITHHVVVQTDMSDYKALEDKFVQSQKMEALGTLVGGIAHDFNNLLSGILGTLYLVKHDPKFDPSLEKQVDTVTELGYQAANLVKSLLAFARKESVEMKPFPLVPFVKETLKLHRMAIPENIMVRSNIGNESFSILADANRLQQVILNLMTNAAYALKERKDPEIRISLSAFEADQSFKQIHPEIKSSEFVHLVVADNGIGIEKQHLSHIFEPFYTTKPTGEGSGLGLAMVYGVVQSHHGVVEINSKPGVGTEAHIYLPVIDEGAHIKVDSVEPEVMGRGETILLADDNELVLNTLAGTLKQLNYQVLEAKNGQESVDIFKQKGDEIDIVVTDIIMPVMGGVKSALMIKELSEKTPIIFLTGYHSEEIDDDMMNLKDVVKLTKPVTQSLLSATIRKMLDQRSS